MATSTLPPSSRNDLIPAPSGDDPIPPPLGSTAAGPAGRRTRVLQAVGLLILLVGTAVLYLWSLSASGYANSFYSAAVQAGSQSWQAFLFGSLDAGNAITVDKPPASLWLMALSVRIFGLSSWSILAPQALLGVATVGVLYASVRRTISGRSCSAEPDAPGFLPRSLVQTGAGSALPTLATAHSAGLLAGALLALTPVAALMFRFNNPDALLVFLLTAAAYATLRASERASGKWLVGAGVLVGFAFLTKMLQAFLVLPAFVLVYLIVAPTSLRRRIKHLLFALAAMIISLGWWVAIVELVPESWRPYIGGSDTNSVLDLIFGYNGLARVLGNGNGNGIGGNGGGGGGFGGAPAITRLFETVSGGMITWLIPAALLLGTVAMIIRRRAPRTDGVRAAIMIWGGWLLVTGLVFSFMAGTYHEYYTVALAPAMAALVAIGGQVLWQHRMHVLARIGLAATMIITAGWAFVLLERATAAYQILQWPVLILGVVAAAGLLFVHRLPRAVAWVVLGLALLGGTTGPAAYSLQTVATPHTGSIVTAGPVTGGGFGGGQAGGPVQGRRDGGGPRQFPGGQPGGTQPGPQVGADGGAVSTGVAELLTSNADSYRWVAAATGSQAAAGYQLATERPVMAIGGFSGGDPSPTLAQFQTYVAEGQIHYYVSGGNRGGGGPGRGDGSATRIATWVAANFTATSVDGVTLYDLTAAQRSR